MTEKTLKAKDDSFSLKVVYSARVMSSWVDSLWDTRLGKAPDRQERGYDLVA